MVSCIWQKSNIASPLYSRTELPLVPRANAGSASRGYLATIRYKSRKGSGILIIYLKRFVAAKWTNPALPEESPFPLGSLLLCHFPRFQIFYSDEKGNSSASIISSPVFVLCSSSEVFVPFRSRNITRLARISNLKRFWPSCPSHVRVLSRPSA